MPISSVAKQHPIDGQEQEKTALTEKIKQLQSELSTLEYRHSDGLIPLDHYALARTRLMEEYDATLKVLCAVHTGHSPLPIRSTPDNLGAPG